MTEQARKGALSPTRYAALKCLGRDENKDGVNAAWIGVAALKPLHPGSSFETGLATKHGRRAARWLSTEGLAVELAQDRFCITDAGRAALSATPT